MRHLALTICTLVPLLSHASEQTNPQSSARSAGTKATEELDAIIVLGKRANSYVTDDTTIAGKSAQPLRSTPGSLSVLNRKLMDDVGATTLEDAMQWATGMAISTNGDGTFVAYNRGYDSGAQFDGLPATKGITSMMQLDLSMYDRVETQRGPSGLLQGSGTPGGSINLVRKRAPRSPMLNLELSYGSWNTRRASLDGGAPLNASGSVRGRMVLTHRDGDFYYKGAGNRRAMAYGVLEIDLGSPNTTLALAASSQASDYTRFWGLPTYTDGRQLNAPRSAFTSTDWSNIDQRTREGIIELGHRFDNGWTLKAAARHRNNGYVSRIAYASGALVRGSTAGNYNTSFSDNTWINRGLEINLTGPFKLWGRQHDLLLGYNQDALDQRVASASGKPIRVADVFHPNLPIAVAPAQATSESEFRVRKSAWYGQLRLRPFDGWTWVIGGRSSNNDNRSRNTLPRTTDWNVYQSNIRGKFTPYAGAVWEPSKDTALYASYSYTFQPNEYLQFNGKVIDPREGWQVEAGIKQGFFGNRLNGTLAV